ncbi:MAG TPA: hypothetical protein VF411_13750 [Bacteroidia bacterium]
MVDGLGYYAYLPATFIYHDYTFSFFNEMHTKYNYVDFSDPPTKQFTTEFDGIRLDKYYPGVSLLWLPFFLLAHLIALLFHLPADGYSAIYQYGIGMAGILYTYLGVRFIKKILTHYKIPPSIQAITLCTIVFGTNLLMHAAVWSSQTHAYSFFLIAAFCWFFIQLMNPSIQNKNYVLCMCFILLAFIFTVRPQNISILLLLPFFGLTPSTFISVVKQNLLSAFSLLGLCVASLIVARVCHYWYVQTGRLILNPYQGEHYYFNKPHVLDMLFSYRKGWILYTPFVAVGLAGIFFFKENKAKINLLFFYGLMIYISSCWWCWTYSTTSFGQRIYVDFYALIALQAAVLFNFFYQRKLKFISPAIALVVIPLNLLQTHQYKHAIIHGDCATAETYWENFFAIKPVAFYAIPKETITNKQEIDFTFDDDMKDSRTNHAFYSGKNSIFICKTRPFSETKKFALPPFMTPDIFSHIRVTTMMKSTPEQSKDESLVIDINRNGKTISYNGFGTSPYIHNSKWTRYQRGMEIPAGINPGDSVTIYFWKSGNLSADTTYIDDLKVEFIHTDKSYQFSL